jgi:hypothetical protein
VMLSVPRSRGRSQNRSWCPWQDLAQQCSRIPLSSASTAPRKPTLKPSDSTDLNKQPRCQLYYDRFALWLLRGYGLVGFVVFLSMAAVHIAVVLRVACGLVGCALLYLTWFRWRRLGVEVCPDGIRIRRAQVQRRRVAWSEIESFCAIPKSPYPAVGAKLKTGSPGIDVVMVRTGFGA